jgi:hypothetical protein
MTNFTLFFLGMVRGTHRNWQGDVRTTHRNWWRNVRLAHPALESTDNKHT